MAPSSSHWTKSLRRAGRNTQPTTMNNKMPVKIGSPLLNRSSSTFEEGALSWLPSGERAVTDRVSATAELLFFALSFAMDQLSPRLLLNRRKSGTSARPLCSRNDGPLTSLVAGRRIGFSQATQRLVEAPAGDEDSALVASARSRFRWASAKSDR